MSKADYVGFNIALIYFIVYGSVFIMASIYCAFLVYEELKSSTNKTCCKKSMKFIKQWVTSLWKKKSVYLALIPHLFDQATDFGVIWKYYESIPLRSETGINFGALFFSSIAAIVVHKVVSCSIIYTLTQSIPDVLLQFFDLMMVKAIYVNYKQKTNEPGNMQRLLQLIEATFESGPQLFISLIFIIKSDQTESLVLMSLITSLWTLASRVNSDDKGLVIDEWKEHQIKLTPCPAFFVNWRYLFRTIGRFIEITNRVILLGLIWICLGGYALSAILLCEVISVFILCIWVKDIMVLGYMLYFAWCGFGGTDLFNTFMGIFALYRYIVSPFVYLILITIFATVQFESWKVEDYIVRHKNIVENNLGFGALIYCWISTVLAAVFVFVMGIFVFDDTVGSTRDVKSLIEAEKWEDLLNLLSFGIAKSRIFFKDESGTVLHYLFRHCKQKDKECFKKIIDEITQSYEVKELWDETDINKNKCYQCAELNEQNTSRSHTKYLMKRKLIKNDGNTIKFVVSDFVHELYDDKDVLFLDDEGTLMHRLFASCRDFDTFQVVCDALVELQPNILIQTNANGLLCSGSARNDVEYARYIQHMVDEHKVDQAQFIRDLDQSLSLESLLMSGDWGSVLKMLECNAFKLEIQLYEDSNTETILHRLFHSCQGFEIFKRICKISNDADNEIFLRKNSNGRLCSDGANTTVPYMSFIQHLIDKYQVNADDIIADLPVDILRESMKIGDWNSVDIAMDMNYNGFRQQVLFDESSFLNKDSVPTILHQLFATCSNISIFKKICDAAVKMDDTILLKTNGKGKLCSATTSANSPYPLFIYHLVKTHQMSKDKLMQDLPTFFALSSVAKRGRWKRVMDFVMYPELFKDDLLFHSDDGSILHYLFANCGDFDVFKSVVDVVVELDESILFIKNKSDHLCSSATSNGDSIPHEEFIAYLVKQFNVNKDDFLRDLFEASKQYAGNATTNIKQSNLMNLIEEDNIDTEEDSTDTEELIFAKKTKPSGFKIETVSGPKFRSQIEKEIYNHINATYDTDDD